MPDALQERRISCPYCGESMYLVVDTSAGGQSYIEDCQICCQPMRIAYSCDASGAIELHVSSEN